MGPENKTEASGVFKDPIFEKDKIKGIIEITDREIAEAIRDGKITTLSIVSDTDPNAEQRIVALLVVVSPEKGRWSDGIHG